jgi:hypothetical protein
LYEEVFKIKIIRVKKLPNTVVLRPRFQIELQTENEKVLTDFENSSHNFILIKRIDEHVFLKFKPKKNHFWSPQLHLEIAPQETKKTSTIYGVFGPNPALWTFFMFLHFGIATLFIALSIWAYSSFVLNKPYGLKVILMLLMIILWISFYIFGRIGKRKGKPQMQELFDYMKTIINE